MARTTREQTEATRQAILGAALALFATRGADGVGLEEIARVAGVTRGAVYHHFGSRQGVFSAVHDQVQATVAAAIDAATADVPDPWESLERGCRAFLEAAVAPAVRQVLLVDAPRMLGWDAWRGADAANSGRMLGDVLRELADRGVIAVGPVDATQALLSGAMNEAALWAATLPDPQRGVEEAWGVLRRMLASLRVGARA
ncbi:TetR family transcriptional regulator [Georgenia sp. H159]|uniref:TetR family transcriptional regulator n=1 Tax=Georgenia sp. H159 TaxID=3076115 RepID=UPI002D7848D6|nr:TetR family transcriptional regulator [Georgenia sp. H159]